MDAFGEIGRAGSREPGRRRAPGISEALIATAMGLLAAIPRPCSSTSSRPRQGPPPMLDDFALEFLNVVERNFT